MTGIFAACALRSTAAPPSGLSGVVTSTFTPRLIMSSAMLANFASLPSAFSMRGSMPAKPSACASRGRSWSSHLVDEVRSGRITPTVGFTLDCPADLAPSVAVPQAATARTKRPQEAARASLRIRQSLATEVVQTSNNENAKVHTVEGVLVKSDVHTGPKPGQARQGLN